MSTEFASARLTAGQLNAIVKKLGGHEMALRFLRGELSVSEPTPSWRNEDGVIYFSVTSDGTTGEDWIKRLDEKGFRVGDIARSMLRSPDFKPTSGVMTEVAVLRFTERHFHQFPTKICDEANERGLSKPNAELACLIRDKFTDKEIEAMGFRTIIIMHEYPKEYMFRSSLLCVHSFGDGRRLDCCYGIPTYGWLDGDHGCVFAVSQFS